MRFNTAFASHRLLISFASVWHILCVSPILCRHCRKDAPVPASAALGKRSVLIVDDDASARGALAEFVETQGYFAFEAADGLAAVKYLAACDSPPKLIFLDLDMPVMDGLEFLSQLPLPRPGSVLPIVIVVTGQDPNVVQGAAAVLRKPVAVDQLLGLMHRLAPLPEKGRR